MKRITKQLLQTIWIAAVTATLTACSTGSLSKSSSTSQIKTNLAPLPEGVTSFGAVTADGWVYAFGGHKGERHDYNVEKVSGSFHRLNLSEGTTWEKLPAAFHGQGLPLVTYRGQVYRIGGMAARNQPDAKQDLYSVALVQRFDPRSKQWSDVTPLPKPRSSHDAVVVGDKLYVAGGWELAGGTSKAVWPANALVLDLAHPEAGWKEFPQPFQRRALALAKIGTRIYCMGGMDSDDKPTLAVDIYDTVSGQWSKGPELPPGRFKGFSCSAIAQDGHIYVNAFQGDLLRLSKDEKSWEVVGRVQYPRLAHRIVTAGKTQIIALGGEDGESKRPELEVLTPSSKPLTNTVSAAAPAADPHGANPHAAGAKNPHAD